MMDLRLLTTIWDLVLVKSHYKHRKNNRTSMQVAVILDNYRKVGLKMAWPAMHQWLVCAFINHLKEASLEHRKDSVNGDQHIKDAIK